MAEGLDSQTLALLDRFESGRLKAQQAISNYLDGKGSAFEALMATLFDRAKIHNDVGNPTPNMAQFILDTMCYHPDEKEQIAAYKLIDREAQSFGQFLDLTRDAEVSWEDKQIFYDAFLAPSFKRMGEWAMERTKRCLNCGQLFFPSRSDALFDSERCKKAYQRAKLHVPAIA